MHDGVEHRIVLKDDIPTKAKGTRRLSPAELEVVRRQLDEWLAKGHISPLMSPYGAHVVLVKKKDGCIRVCVDYRALNQKTVRDAYEMRHADQLLQTLAGATVFSKLDLMTGYNQVAMATGDRHKTAFNTRFGHYEFNVLPFGLCNAPATLMRYMNDVFRDALDRFVIVYLDDILVFSKAKAEHERHLGWVLDRLGAHSLYAKRTKCDVAVPSVEFLGFMVDGHGAREDP